MMNYDELWLSEEKSDWSLHWSEKLAKGEMLQPVQLGKQMNRGNIMDYFLFFFFTLLLEVEKPFVSANAFALCESQT